MSYVKNYFEFGASLWYLTSCENFKVIRPVVPEILGGGASSPPQLQVRCSHEQMRLTVNRESQVISKGETHKGAK